ncbi:MAG: diguanylate cyclase [Aliarcobacter sp.]|nr:diguanylate cyclase [Aliarcobacter sp.]
MKLSFKYKFILSFVLLEIIFISLIVFYNFSSLRNLSNSLVHTNVESSSKLFSELIKTPLIINDLATIDNAVESFNKIEYISAVRITNMKNFVISHLNDENQYKDIFDNNIENMEINGKIFQLKSFLIEINEKKLANVQILYELTDIYNVIKDNRNRTFFLIILEILISTLIAYFVGYRLTKRLTSLTILAEKISKNKQVIIKKDGSIIDEVSILANTLSIMQDKIFQRNNELQELVQKLEYSSTRLKEELSFHKEIERKLEKYIKLVNENIIISRTNLEGIITDVSEAFCKISGFSAEELIGQSHVLMRHEDTPLEVYENLWKTITSGKIWKAEVKNKTKDGSFYWTDSTIYPDYDNNGNIIGYYAIRHDITNKKFIENLSITDPLTKLYNRRYFDDMFYKEINRAKRDKTMFCLLLLDVDYFKLYNDTYGHQEGDVVLQTISKVLIQNLKRPSDFAFRMGGEEFSAIFTMTQEKDIYEFSESIRKSIENTKMEHKKNKVSAYVTVSIGVTYVDFRKNNEINIVESVLYKYVDELLYKAKASGRNKVFIEDWSEQ